FDLEEIDDPDGLLEQAVHPAHMVDTEAMVNEMLEDQKQKGLAAMDMAAAFDDTTRGLALEYKAVYDKAVCEGVQAKLEDEEDLIFDLSTFDEPGAPCSFTDENTGEVYTDASACEDDQICTFLDQGDIQRKYCLTPCNTGDLLDQLRSEIRRVNQISNQAYWDPNALYTDVKDDRVRTSQLAMRSLIEPIREEVFEDVFDRMWSTIALHEVGHCMGLRHNFASSTDALNFFPEYWELKGTEDSEGSWYPTNLWERDTRNQVSQRMRENQQTSVMEYGSGFNSRYKGLGAYDYAAVYFAYGGLLNVFNDGPDMTQFDVDLEEPEDSDPTNFGLTVSIEQPLAKVLRKRHHTNFPELFGGVDNMYDRRAVPWQDLIYRTDTVNGEACTEASATCTEVACDMFDDPYSSDVCPEAGSFCRPFPTGFFCSRPDLVEVPIRFCSDEYNSRSPTCQTRDEGADSFEIVANSIDDYEAYWPFRAYKRDNDLFYPGRTYYGRVMSDMIQWRKHWEHW
ncbi:MAG: zinc-dependent metalloprotease, partial [Myxococcota bacterium]|nr:zinc-dependent metalloprotease [Myxococcota bacterium]